MPRIFADPLRERLARYAAILTLDAALTALALQAAMLLRFEGAITPPYEAALPPATALLVGLRLASNVAAQLHCWSFRFSGLPDAVRIATAVVAGSTLFVALAPWVAPPGMPRTVYALEFFLSSTGFALLRFGPRVALRWWGEAQRRRNGAMPTLVVGVNLAAELLVRDIVRGPQRLYDVVGLVGTDPSAIGRRLDGKPILGLVEDLASIIQRHRVKMVLLAIPRLDAASLRNIVSVCSSCRVQFKILPAYTSLTEISAAMLDDVAPEDLLPRPQVQFDAAELRRLVEGRRALVTGAGGSIGGEICRQLVEHGVRQLVMVDMNENELYLGARRLSGLRSDLEIRAEVADIREGGRLLRLGERYRPEYVFHAAAHKHVPLMEDAPEEAVKNNVFGTLNVARMADACGAERFVLVSTDKAVNPSSVMGATKRVAELVVRDLARRSRTKVTAVRFGNVLGSAGSVVPIFKEQIARGGPVTVTHPQCTRYFMTIPEAVGLVLVAGLGDYGELCVLDMGEPIKVDELARLMIALSGRVVGSDIQIVYTGLRPGEKLTEELLTEEEEQSHAVRDRIYIARSPAPPPDLALRLQDLARYAEAGDRGAILRVLRVLVPTFQPVAAPDAARAPAHRPADAEVRPRPTPTPQPPRDAGIGAPAPA